MAIYRGPITPFITGVFRPTLWTLLAIAGKSVVFVGCCFFFFGVVGQEKQFS